jgi:menaquinone-dependent protoporphyrinogen IX oxidase
MREVEEEHMNAVLVYATKLGSTRQYAEWIAKDLGITAVSVKDVKTADLERAQTVILGSAVRMARLIMGKWITAQWPLLQRKRLVLFSVSGTPPEATEKLREILGASIGTDMINAMAYFPLHGRVSIEKLPLPLKLMMKMMKKSKSPAKGDAANLLLEFDDVKREHITPIVQAVQRV